MDDIESLIDDARTAGWQEWEDANGGAGSLTFDIEQGWDAAWDVVAGRLLPGLLARVWREGHDHCFHV